MTLRHGQIGIPLANQQLQVGSMHAAGILSSLELDCKGRQSVLNYRDICIRMTSNIGQCDLKNLNQNNCEAKLHIGEANKKHQDKTPCTGASVCVRPTGLKDSSRHLQLNCIINYFLTAFNISCMCPKIRCDGYYRENFGN